MKNFLDKKNLNDFLNNKNYDLRISKNGRWIDQKCTPDICLIVSDAVIEYINQCKNIRKNFSVKDIWYSKYATDNIVQIFKKPNPNNKSKNEYDKFFAQPLEMFVNSGILSKSKQGRKNIYKVDNYNMLEYISLNERNSREFISEYIKKVISDSGIAKMFNDFFDNQDPSTFYFLKTHYAEFIKKNTPINNDLECNRIFSKVLNPMAFQKNKRGTVRGRISKDIISIDKLNYNKKNFRDIIINKPKNVSRNEYEISEYKNKLRYHSEYESYKAKKRVRNINIKYRGGKSEIAGDKNTATQMHHIFPCSYFPQLSGYCENIIALTPNQHNLYAHPNNKTSLISRDYQQTCLINKTITIQKNIENKDREQIYSFIKFMKVLSVGLGDKNFEKINSMDFNEVIKKINSHFAANDNNIF